MGPSPLEQVAESTGAGNRSFLRRKNSLAVLEVAWSHELTAGAIAARTGLSRTATESVLTDLVSAGWMQHKEPSAQRASAGRPASTYHVRADSGHLFAIDVGAHHVTVLVSDLRGHERARRREVIGEQATPDERFALVDQLLRDLEGRTGCAVGQAWCLSVGSPGVVQQGRVAYFGGQGMPGWAGVDIAERLKRDYARPVLVEGDCALGALAEQWRGTAVDARNVVFLLCGQRTGAAAVIDGQLHRGAHGSAGLIGELSQLQWQDLEHERYGSARLEGPRPNREAIFALARAADPWALAAVQDFARSLALGASAMALALDPDRLVIGGPGADYADLLLTPFNAELRRHCPWPPPVSVSALGPDAAAIGAVRLFVLRLFDTLVQAVQQGPSFPAPTADILADTRPSG